MNQKFTLHGTSTAIETAFNFYGKHGYFREYPVSTGDIKVIHTGNEQRCYALMKLDISKNHPLPLYPLDFPITKRLNLKLIRHNPAEYVTILATLEICEDIAIKSMFVDGVHSAGEMGLYVNGNPFDWYQIRLKFAHWQNVIKCMPHDYPPEQVSFNIEWME